MSEFSSDRTGESSAGFGRSRKTAAQQPEEALSERLKLVGCSNQLLQAQTAISTLGQIDAPVLITGETGTGKELAARGLHYGGLRDGNPFVALNCATFTDELFASEIFGHRKGAFTDARDEKRGLLAVAGGGTLFLDEIDSLSLKSQAALLRFLQAMEYRPVGSETVQRADVRIVASCNQDMQRLIQDGAFRQDLFYRLYIFSLHMPSLRDRREDISVLVRHFLDQFRHQYRKGTKQLSVRLLGRLEQHDWPGNVRELENLMHRLYLSTTYSEIDVDAITALPPGPELGWLHPESDSDTALAYTDNIAAQDHGCDGFDFSRDKREAIEAFERRYVARLLEYAGGNVSQAARLCGKERRALGKLVKKYGLSKRQAEYRKPYAHLPRGHF